MTSAERRKLRRRIAAIRPPTETERRVQELVRELGGADQLTPDQLSHVHLTVRAQMRVSAIDQQLRELDPYTGDGADKKVLQLMDRRSRLSDHVVENLRQLGLKRKNYLTAGGLDEDALLVKLLAEPVAPVTATPSGSQTASEARGSLLDKLDLDPHHLALLKRVIN